MSKHNRPDIREKFTRLKFATRAIISAGLLATVVAPAQADQIDCKVILCLAGGFPGGCEDAYSYMIDRITDIPPKPPYGICETQNLDGTTGVYNGAHSNMFTRSEPPVCTQTHTYYGEDAGTQCVRWSITHNATIRIAVDTGTDARPFTNEYIWRTWTVETQVDPTSSDIR